MSRHTLALCLSTAIALGGCASIVSKSQYPVTINSTPPGAAMVIRNKAGAEIHRAQTPATVTLPAGSGYFGKAEYSIGLEKEGYQSSQVALQPTLDPWYLGNIIFGGLIGLLIVDPATGAMWQLDQNLLAGLTPLPGYVPPAAPVPQPPLAAPAAPAAPAAAPAAVAGPAPEVSALPVAPVVAEPAAAPAPVAPAKSIGDRLKELKALRDDGVLSEQEYQAKRTQLIESL